MNSFWDKDVPFIPLLGPDHLLYLGIMAACLVALLAGRGWVRRHSEGVRWALLVVSAAQFLTLYAWYATEFGFDPSEALPLHIAPSQLALMAATHDLGADICPLCEACRNGLCVPEGAAQ